MDSALVERHLQDLEVDASAHKSKPRRQDLNTEGLDKDDTDWEIDGV